MIRPLTLRAWQSRAGQDGRLGLVVVPVAARSWTVNGYRFKATDAAWGGLNFDEAKAREKCPWTGVPDAHLAPRCY
jgi:hypothetical protein